MNAAGTKPGLKATQGPKPVHVIVLSSAVATKVSKPAGMDHTAVVAKIRFVQGAHHYDMTVIHCSGKFDEDVQALVDYHKRLIKFYQADILTTTESEEPRVQAAEIKALGPLWSVRRVSEYMVCVRNAVCEFDGARPKPRLAQYSRNEDIPEWRNLYVGIFWVKLHVNGSIDIDLCVTVGHTPSDVEYGNSWRHDSHAAEEQVLDWMHGVAKWGQYTRNKRTRPVCYLINGDMNVDMSKQVWLKQVHKYMGPDLVVCWDKHQPSQGSHGNRLIDMIAVRVAAHG